MNDGNEVIAKIPCPNAGPPSLTTASEVATLKFLRSRTSIRVPKVLAWSADAANSVGAEYIIMEKIRGVALSEKWEVMNTLERYKIVDQVVQIEKELVNISFPAYGSLFLRDSLPATCRQYPLPAELDPEGLFCIGPSCKRTWWHGNFVDRFRSVSKDMGPWARFSEYALSIVQRELAHIRSSGAEVQRQLHKFDESQSIDEYESLLENVNMALPILSHDPRVTDASDPVVWHTDLHLGNIFVSPNEPSIIEGIIDWQSSQICPLFIQARFPEFLTPPKDYTFGPDLPALPDGFDDHSPEQKEQAINEKELASRSKYYEMSSLAHNRCIYNAMKLDSRLWEPFTYCQLFSQGSLVPLRHCLIRLSQDWSSLGLPGSCPFLISENELQRHNEQKLKYEDRLYLCDLVKSQLFTDDAGWVPNDRWEATEKANKELYNMYVETMSEELTPQAAAKNWPFPP
ncbi:uncharacterized protein ACLA_085470 [Aspergillus clavatus NRRL 1]|uniref:Altered inheritance of mitochondria protein 9, mitochondrial n=1 Tax=Aspergillus clavatus (strain ATCC 1007 / CBS 513.65 / DSM 816 / NCTC 3887 / NRRL 1 / QM 1276 / 107) TaxID=344612 RepID=A1CU65_ASPCL|nr:uncharacterized protein ACLA_085470 [Aspergillus clavatus NRRL 1]EAW06852.1 conserved hypothetical protein [Aspergillus clavatus NRRL 1]